jgi:hypothetical protein
LQTDEEEQTYQWKEYGRDGYVIDAVIAWAHATPTRTNHQSRHTTKTRTNHQ